MRKPMPTTDLKNLVDVPVLELFSNRELYQEYPPYQRENCWSERREKLFVRYMMRESTLSTSCVALHDVNRDGREILRFIDGRQRFETSLKFLQNGFPTLTDEEAQIYFFKSASPEPGRVYSELSRSSRDKIDRFIFRFTLFEKEQEDELEEIFLSLNEMEPLSNAERLYIHNGRARHVALSIVEHPFWSTTYQGHGQRRETFQAATQLLAIEVNSFPVNLRMLTSHPTPLNRLIMGDHDNELTETLENTILQRLTVAQRLFEGSHCYGKNDVIPMYQAILLLEQDGFDLRDSERGCLAAWYNAAQRGTIIEHLERKIPLRALDFVGFQRDFWHVQKSSLFEHFQQGL